MSINTRYIAASVISQVIQGRSLTDSLEQAFLENSLEQRDKAFVQALCFGVCRYYPRLRFILSYLVKKPIKEKDIVVESLLLIGFYQLMEMRVSPYAAISETVNAIKKKKPWAGQLINAVLREFQRQQQVIMTRVEDNLTAKYLHPQWMIEQIRKDWPDDYTKILTANNEQPPFSLRVNQRLISREDYIKLLSLQNLEAHPNPHTQNGVVLTEPLPVNVLPGFLEGKVTVQDGAAQLCAEFLEVKSGQRILDACAAPGGKLTHILELAAADCVAVEKDNARFKSIEENLTRLNLTCKTVCADVLNLDQWWDKKDFDRILLDAPCSASGVIRRHPDIKLLRRPKDIEQFSLLQLQLLETLWTTLKDGGVLLYSTCSVFKKENDEVILNFLRRHTDAELMVLPRIGANSKLGMQIIPGMHEMDGFFYAKLKKQV